MPLTSATPSEGRYQHCQGGTTASQAGVAEREWNASQPTQSPASLPTTQPPASGLAPQKEGRAIRPYLLVAAAGP